jgi:acetyl esterase
VLNADVIECLDKLNALGVAPPEQCTPDQARENFNFLTMGDETVVKVSVENVQDITIDGPGSPLMVRIYTPLGTERPVPTIVFFHGGGFVLGSINTHDKYARKICAQTGCVVASVDYRLAPENPFPAAVDDADCAVAWASDSIGQLGGDKSRLVVMGVSAGGALTATSAIAAASAGIPLALQVLLYPCTDGFTTYPSLIQNANGPFLTKKEMEWYYGHYSDSSYENLTNPRLSPMFAELPEKLAPALVVTAEHDPLRDEGNAYAAKLATAGIDVELQTVSGAVHGFFGYNAQTEIRSIDRFCAAVRHKLDFGR